MALQLSSLSVRSARSAALPHRQPRRQCVASSHSNATPSVEASASASSRRDVLVGLTTLACWRAAPSEAVQGYIPGRIPGLSKDTDDKGFYTYTRPDGKQGGHGVGWSELPKYKFKVPTGWDETPVSIADLGGTEIDLRFAKPETGQICVVVAPVLRFLDVGFNADVRIQQIGAPDKIIAGFAPELFGGPLEPDTDILATNVVEKDGLTYYNWELKTHTLVTATAFRNRVLIMTVKADTSRLWRKHEGELRTIQDSFAVVA